MANYTVANSSGMGVSAAAQAMSTSYKTVITLYNSATHGGTNVASFARGKLYDLLVGTDGAVGDTAMKYRVSRASVGSPVSASISSLSSNFGVDFADNGGSRLGISINATAETSITPTTEMWMVGVNQRASYRWVAAPGSELVLPANSSTTGNNGLICQAQCTQGGYTGTVTNTVMWNE
jgi:hypothetical protein